ncbi:MAG: N-acetyl-gamma-glutamyl-phosphate reductase [Prevotella sp.]|nr:N-acetyl-gamma-glutamyl-phosphate reductase [Prevotella sp.]
MVKVGIVGAAGYTGGELIRLLVNHPQAEIVFAHSESNAGNLVADVHEGLYGDCSLRFTEELPFSAIDVLFLCFGHGKSRQFLQENTVPESVKIIDLAQDFRLADGTHDFVYGLPEHQRKAIISARHIANPGCFATCIQLALLPLARHKLLKSDIVVNGITGATGAGQKPAATTHYAWRADNLSVYKPFTHQHLHEIRQTLRQEQGTDVPVISFIPMRGDFARGIFITAMVECELEEKQVISLYKESYADEPFTHYCDRPIDLKQVVNTNKCLVHCDVHEGRLLVTAAIDNLLKGASGQAVENMNLIFGINEQHGLRLKPIAF